MFITENISRIHDEMGKLQIEMEEISRNKGGTSKEIEEKEYKIQELKNTIENSGELFEEIKQQIEHSKKEREELFYF